MNSIPLTVARAPYPVGMVRIYGAEAIALAEQTGVWVDVGAADGAATMRLARVAMLSGRRVSLTIAATLDI